MEKFQQIFEKEGFSFMFNTKEDSSFFHCLYSAKNNSRSADSRNAEQMQKELYEFEEKKSMHFHLFQPHYIDCDGDHSAVDCLKKELERMRLDKRPPSPREVFAAADLLHKYICLYRCNEFDRPAIQNLRGYIFAPTNKNDIDTEPLCILMVEKRNGYVEFANFFHTTLTKELDNCPGVLPNKHHMHCFGTRFANAFSLLFDDVSYEIERMEKDLYRRLSLVFYGNESQHVRILNIICKCELEDDNLDLFSKYADNSLTDETSLSDKRDVLNTHVKSVKDRKKPSSKGEFYAVSSVYNVDVIVDETGTKEWERYMSVVCTFASCFDSPVILHKKDGGYLPYVTECNACSCSQKKPEIQGHVGKVKASISKAVLKNPCCPPEGPRQNHTHLKNRLNVKTALPQETVTIYYRQPQENDNFQPREEITEEKKIVITRLAEECRRLDHTKGSTGSLAEVLATELFGVENEFSEREILDAMGGENLKLDEKLLKLSEWLNVPIYVYCGVEANDGHQHYLWVKYEPFMSKKEKDCRFYITLFYDLRHRLFDRITPVQGCNCQIPPPISLLLNSREMGHQYLDIIDPNNRHHPLVNFLSTAPDVRMFEMEIRDFPVCSPFSIFKIAIEMDTMEERTFDCLKVNRHSLLRCLSKEIFGTEDHFEKLITELSKELMQNISQYIPYIGENIKKAYKNVGELKESNREDREKMAKFIIERIEDDLPCDELLLWLVCTFFQTPVYVFRINDKTSYELGFWTGYEKLYRKKMDPPKKTSFLNKCRRDGVYYISLLETGMTQYYRIIPKSMDCNCMLKKPCSLRSVADPTKYQSHHDYTFMRSIREMDNCLRAFCIEIDQWLLCNQMLQEKCDAMILEIEGRRKNVNIVTITGTGAGIVGAALTGVGIALIPFTAGLSTVLTVGGAALAVSGGTIATGAKVAESLLNRNTIDLLKRNQNCYQERLEIVKILMIRLRNALKQLNEICAEIKTNQHLKDSDFANVQSIPGILRAIEGIIMIPIGLLRVSVRGVLILSAIIGPLTALVDAALLVFSAINLAEGNKTDITENLRRTSAALYGSRRQMHNWAYGTEKQFIYN